MTVDQRDAEKVAEDLYNAFETTYKEIQPSLGRYDRIYVVLEINKGEEKAFRSHNWPVGFYPDGA